MKETLERELKLSVKRGFEMPPLPADVTPRHLRATYYDTDDHRLARHVVTLRRRDEDGRDLWQLKLPSEGARLELEWEADGPDVPAELQSLLTAYLRGSALRPIAELHTLRRAVRVSAGGGPAAEVVHDSVQVLEGDQVVREFDEVEVEQLTPGADRLVARLERQLRAAGAKTSDGRPRCSRRSTCPRPRAEGPSARLLRSSTCVPTSGSRWRRCSAAIPPRGAATATACTGCALRRGACAASSRRRSACSTRPGSIRRAPS